VKSKSAGEKRVPIEMTEGFIKTLKEWQKLEDVTIDKSDMAMEKSKNPIVQMVMEVIKHDSEKHKAMQQLLIDALTKQQLHLSPEELAPLADALKKHVEAEAKSIEYAQKALEQCELFATRYILTMLLADEAKHHRLLGDLNEMMLKRATIFVT
jgi:hypothetical protein